MRILLADDQPRVRSAMRFLLEQQSELNVVDEVVSTRGLFDYIRDHCPDMLLLEWDLPGLTFEKLFNLRALCPSLVVIVLNSRPQTEQVALEAGANAFVSKNDPPEHLLAVINNHRKVDIRK